MERDSTGGQDVGRDLERDLGDEPPASIRDAAPDYLSPIDESSPVSGHTPPPESARRRSICPSTTGSMPRT